ncbi:MAG: RAMP superfamily CRISPR-associated protein [Candidatus Sericytochromatia bacterium]
MMNNKKNIKGKIILNGKIKLISPARVGSGKNENTDTDILRDTNGNPYIPATSFIGVLKHTIKVDNIDLKNIWGFTEKNTGEKSSIYCSDLILSKNINNSIEIRDGIKIENKTGIVEDKAKYDFEVVKKDLEFNLKLELDIFEENYDLEWKLLSTIVNLLENSKISIGSKTNSGFGKIKLIEKSICYLDFSNKLDVLKWLRKDFSNNTNKKLEPFDLIDNTFYINASFSLKNSIIIRSYNENNNYSDAVHLKSGDDDIISGTSLKGAFRSRAEKISKTLEKKPELILKLFGNVDNKYKKDRAVKSKVKIDEVVLPKFIAEMQTRIKIDRFTGGTIEGALFDTMPLFKDVGNSKIKNVSITINKFKPHEVGLLLLVLKDLWTGDLAVGGEKNIGSGVFQGEEATISWNNEKIILNKDFKISEEDKQKIENFVTSFVNYKE